MTFGLLQGAVSQSSARALVLCKLGARPSVSVTRQGTAVGTSHVTRQRPPEKLAKQIEAHQLSVYVVEISGLASGSWHLADITAGEDTRRIGFTTLPSRLPDSGLTVAVASCYYDGFGMQERLYRALKDMQLGSRAVFAIWAGDNLYMDVPRLSPEHETNVAILRTQAYAASYKRYQDYFHTSKYGWARQLLPNFTTYDDHEFWNNYPEPQLWLPQSFEGVGDEYGNAARDCLELFQASINPPRVADGLSYRFDVPPLSFFVAEVRSRRTRRSGGRMLTNGDLAALERWALTLSGPGVLVLGQPLWISSGNSFDYNPPDFPSQYARIWRAVADAPYEILMVSGDVHHSRLMKLNLSGNKLAYEFVTSPATHIPGEEYSVGLAGASQKKNSFAPGDTPPGSGQNLKASYYFGTDAPNTLGMLRFVPKPDQCVEVSAGFVDYSSSARWAARSSCQTPSIQSLSVPGSSCLGERLFVLRKRA